LRTTSIRFVSLTKLVDVGNVREQWAYGCICGQALSVWTCLVALLKEVVDVGVESAHIVATVQGHASKE